MAAGYDIGVGLSGSSSSGASQASGLTLSGGGKSGYSYGLTTPQLAIIVTIAVLGAIAAALLTFRLVHK